MPTDGARNLKSGSARWDRELADQDEEEGGGGGGASSSEKI